MALVHMLWHLLCSIMCVCFSDIFLISLCGCRPSPPNQEPRDCLGCLFSPSADVLPEFWGSYPTAVLKLSLLPGPGPGIVHACRTSCLGSCLVFYLSDLFF